jgi:hypothetical protein
MDKKDKEKKTNQYCLEQILVKLTQMILNSGFENIKDLYKLVDMATSVSAELYAIENGLIQILEENEEEKGEIYYGRDDEIE